MAAFAKYVDSALRKVLAVTLDGSSAEPAAQPPAVHLAGLAQVRLCGSSGCVVKLAAQGKGLYSPYGAGLPETQHLRA